MSGNSVWRKHPLEATKLANMLGKQESKVVLEYLMAALGHNFHSTQIGYQSGHEKSLQQSTPLGSDCTSDLGRSHTLSALQNSADMECWKLDGSCCLLQAGCTAAEHFAGYIADSLLKDCPAVEYLAEIGKCCGCHKQIGVAALQAKWPGCCSCL